jgi:hypothetical protein
MTHDLHMTELRTETTGEVPLSAAPASADARASTESKNPNVSPPADAVAACFSEAAEADRVASDLAAAGIAREAILVFHDRLEKRDFLKRYIHRDNDRHTHSNVASAIFASGGAVAVGLISVVMAAQYTAGSLWPIVAALVGGLVGAVMGSLLGGFAMRPADDRSMAMVEDLCGGGTLVAVRPSGSTLPLDEASRILSRHNGRAFRLAMRANQADLHPGDTRIVKETRTFK